MDRETAKTIHAEIDAALGAIAARHNIMLAKSRATFNAVELRCNTTFTVKGEDGQDLAAKTLFNAYAALYGLQKEDFGRMFKVGSQVFKITGINPKRKQYPISATGESGKAYKFPAESVQRALGYC